MNGSVPMVCEAMTLRVELYGLPAVLTGQRRVEVTAATLQELVHVLAAQFPSLCGTVIDLDRGWLNRGYIFVVDGRFTRHPATPLHPGSEVLLVAAQAGG